MRRACGDSARARRRPPCQRSAAAAGTALARRDEWRIEQTVELVDELPRALVAHAHAPARGRDRAGFADAFEQIRLAGPERTPGASRMRRRTDAASCLVFIGVLPRGSGGYPFTRRRGALRQLPERRVMRPRRILRAMLAPRVLRDHRRFRRERSRRSARFRRGEPQARARRNHRDAGSEGDRRDQGELRRKLAARAPDRSRRAGLAVHFRRPGLDEHGGCEEQDRARNARGPARQRARARRAEGQHDQARDRRSTSILPARSAKTATSRSANPTACRPANTRRSR